MAIVGQVYEYLYHAGLQRRDVSIETVTIYDGEISPQSKEDWLLANTLLVDVVEWLLEEQVIYSSSKTNSNLGVTVFEGVQLSAKGIALLQDPEILMMEAEHGDSKPSSPEYVPGHYTKIGEAVGSAMAGFVKVFANG